MGGYTGAMLPIKFEESDDESSSMCLTSKIYNATTEALTNVGELYSSPSVRRNVVAVIILWSCIGAASIDVYIASIYKEIGISDVYLSTLLFSIAYIPGHVLSTLLIDQFGRKNVYSCSMILAAITLIYLTWIVKFATDTSSHAFQIVAASCLYSVWISSAWGSVLVMISEVFPTKVRSTAIGICTLIARSSNMTVQLMYGQLIRTPTVLLSVASILLTLGAIVTAYTGIDEMAKVALSDITERE